jgi:hypothetical protein
MMCIYKGVVWMCNVDNGKFAWDDSASKEAAQQVKRCPNGDATCCKNIFFNNSIDNLQPVEIVNIVKTAHYTCVVNIIGMMEIYCYAHGRCK